MSSQVTGIFSPWLQKKRIEEARPHLRGRVLDFGSGTGELAGYVSTRDYTGYDIDPQVVAEAQRRHPGYVFRSDLPAPNQTFDTIVMLAVLEHLQNPVAELANLAARLAPRGRIVLTTPHPAFGWVHTIGARLGLFSREAAQQHETLVNRRALIHMTEQLGLSLTRHRRFLFGANQMAVLSRGRDGA